MKILAHSESNLIRLVRRLRAAKPSGFSAVKWIVLSICVATAPLLSSVNAVAAVEKWIDANGQVHYSDQTPPGVDAERIDVRPNVIETDATVPWATSEDRSIRQAPDSEPMAPAEPTLRTDIQSYIELCSENRGVDCEVEARQMIDGPAPLIFPGDPAVFPRPDIPRPPPGLRLKFSIRP